MEENDLHIVIVGHVDHGKSTLVGRLLYDTGSLAPERYEELKALAGEGGEVEFAHVMDHLQEERDRGITIDIAHTFFKTDKRRYVIIDAPGHKEFLKNMITGSSQAEAALLLVDAERGIEEQTRRHCFILSLLNIRQVVVVINKMDLVGYSEQTFNKVSAEIKEALADLGITPSYIVPVSASKGDNIVAASENTAWYRGATVVAALDSFTPLKIEEKGLRFPVQDIYDFQEGAAPVVVGRVESGVLSKGGEVSILPSGSKARITEIKKFEEEGLTKAAAGECVGICLDGPALKRGDVVVDDATSVITDLIRANIFWMTDRAYKKGLPLTWKGATQEARGGIERIVKRFDPASIEVVQEDAEEIKPAEVAEVEIRLDKAVVVDKFTEIPEMGRFVLEYEGEPVAGGVIL